MFSIYSNGILGNSDSTVIASMLGSSENMALHVHGASDSAQTWMEKKERFPVFNDIFNEGYSILSPTLGGPQTWGNDVQQSAITDAYNYIKLMTGRDRITIIAQSMGGLGAFIWAKNNPEKVDRIAAFIPVINLNDLHGRPDYYRGLIDQAYGGSYDDNVIGDQRNPLRIAANGDLSGINICVWYGSDDELCKPEYAVDFAASTGCKLISVPGGHQEKTVSNIAGDAFRKFIRWQ